MATSRRTTSPQPTPSTSSTPKQSRVDCFFARIFNDDEDVFTIIIFNGLIGNAEGLDDTKSRPSFTRASRDSARSFLNKIADVAKHGLTHCRVAWWKSPRDLLQETFRRRSKRRTRPTTKMRSFRHKRLLERCPTTTSRRTDRHVGLHLRGSMTVSA